MCRQNPKKYLFHFSASINFFPSYLGGPELSLYINDNLLLFVFSNVRTTSTLVEMKVKPFLDQLPRAELRHAGENKQMPVKTKCADQSIKPTEQCAYCTSHALHNALSACMVCFVSEQVVARENC